MVGLYNGSYHHFTLTAGNCRVKLIVSMNLLPRPNEFSLKLASPCRGTLKMHTLRQDIDLHLESSADEKQAVSDGLTVYECVFPVRKAHCEVMG